MVLSAFLDDPALSAGNRRSDRRKLRLHVQGNSAGAGVEVLVHDISASGLLIESDAPLGIGEPLDLELPHAGTVGAKVVWTNGRFFGCRFDMPISQATLSAATLRGALPPERPAAAAPAPDAQRFGARLRRLRVAHGLDQAEVARRIGVTPQTVARWEKGAARPSDRRLAALADLLQASLDEMEGDPAPDNLREVIAACRDRIAGVAGVDVAMVSIRIQF